MAEPPTIFISHDHADAAVADALCEAVDTLFGDRVSVIYSTKRGDNGAIRSGENWFRWIGEQARTSRVALVLLTPTFVASPEWLLWETAAVFGVALAQGDDDERRVRPLAYRLRSAQIPDPVRKANLQTLQGTAETDMKQFFKELVTDLDVFTDNSQVLKFGERLDAAVTRYLEEVAQALDASPIVPIRPEHAEVLAKCLELAIEGVRALHPKAKLNARYFFAARDQGRDVLVRADAVRFESDPLPGEFGLRMVDVENDADTIVICKSFKLNTPIYQVLEPELLEKYRPELKDHIDPKQGWVLACPVNRRDDGAIAGVICLYGRKPPARDDDEVYALKNFAVTLSEMFELLLP